MENRFQYGFQPIKFVNLVVSSSREAAPYCTIIGRGDLSMASRSIAITEFNIVLSLDHKVCFILNHSLSVQEAGDQKFFTQERDYNYA